MKILITGNMGYIGPVLVDQLRAKIPDATLIGYDAGYFAHVLTAAGILPETQLDKQIFADVRDIEPSHLEGIDAVVHLAAISNDPMGNRYEAVTADINQRASLRVAELARDAGVKAFVFASSCSMYGCTEGGPRKESDELNPLTAYARSKAGVEAGLRRLDSRSMTVTALRFATACGFSPRLRLDLVLNDFVACALTSRRITVLSDGTPWRPLIDVADMARAIHWAILRAPSDGGRYLAINAGRNGGNYQVRELADAVASAVPGTSVEINTAAPPDKRSYQVDFSAYEALVPRQNQAAVSLDRSIAELVAGLQRMGFGVSDFRNSNYMRLKVIEEHMAAGRLTSDLRWTARLPRSRAAA